MIRFENVGFRYAEKPVLQEISLTVSEGEFVALIGPNGAGKSTLLKISDGILSPISGQVYFLNQPLRKYTRKELAKGIGYVPQHFSLAFDYSAHQICLMGRYPYLSPFSTESVEDLQAVRRAMEATEVWELRNRNFSQLSGGEQQRVILASALAQNPRLLILDEPTSALDIKHQLHFYQILRQLISQGNMAIVVATHDINLATHFCRRLIVLKEGRIIADGAPERVVQKALMESVYEVKVEILTHPQTGRPLLITTD